MSSILVAAAVFSFQHSYLDATVRLSQSKIGNTAAQLLATSSAVSCAELCS